MWQVFPDHITSVYIKHPSPKWNVFLFFAVPLPPQNVQITTPTPSSAQIQWQAPAGGVRDGYLVVTGPTNGVTENSVMQVPAGTTSHTINNISPDTDFIKLYTTSGQQLSVPGFPVTTSK